MDSVTRTEKFMVAAAGEDAVLPVPVTRKELFLAEAAGMAVKPPEPVTREEMFLSRIGGASEWSDLGEAVTNLGDTLTWDGNTEGKVTFCDGESDYVKISNCVPTVADFTNGFAFTASNGDEMTGTNENVATQDDGIINVFGFILIVPDDIGSDLSPGVYFTDYRNYGMDVYVSSLTIPGYNFTETTIKPVPEKYLPEVTELIMVSPNGNKFKVTVDDSGNLTATQA